MTLLFYLRGGDIVSANRTLVSRYHQFGQNIEDMLVNIDYSFLHWHPFFFSQLYVIPAPFSIIFRFWMCNIFVCPTEKKNIKVRDYVIFIFKFPTGPITSLAKTIVFVLGILPSWCWTLLIQEMKVNWVSKSLCDCES